VPPAPCLTPAVHVRCFTFLLGFDVLLSIVFNVRIVSSAAHCCHLQPFTVVTFSTSLLSPSALHCCYLQLLTVVTFSASLLSPSALHCCYLQHVTVVNRLTTHCRSKQTEVSLDRTALNKGLVWHVSGGQTNLIVTDTCTRMWIPVFMIL
jgi:hypothetical protein